MSEMDIYLMYMPQLIELVGICQQMSHRNYDAWKKETMGTAPQNDVGVMEKILIITDRCLEW